ncbi:MAG TPA: DUF433 domain-containing protein [Flavipsychrobacter sp.]|nr:DUF433 domain-containing protein [Flavipsychrobacter sp.]
MSNPELSELLKRITINPGIFAGKPIIRNMRFAVTDVLDLLAAGMTPKEIVVDFPFLEEDDIKAALAYASLRLSNTRIIHAA